MYYTYLVLKQILGCFFISLKRHQNIFLFKMSQIKIGSLYIFI
jgi:hypothetical protein